ncbi:VPS10 domain-containing protein [Lacihabitans sp. CS3-21]|uniref:VPS10 domain-containing protein n=1 Tax=Lacihabitans sp. CS3-21 TaxID=2487332 RepID=UPI0020CFB1B0|nr:glycosyl hydrolase [Lacihabitans sp. CS3-21]MCP9746005.1 glycosyl hydrolase [Lacihabitans sp. CS3-21]
MKKISFLILLLSVSGGILAQKKKAKTTEPVAVESPKQDYKKLYDGLQWRNVGPFRGGRSLAVAGHKDHPMTYYYGAVGGGVWKTSDGGQNWAYTGDSTFKSSSVGAIAVAPSDPNVLYVGMGEADMRSNISYGDGMYKSTNAGKSWKHIGLPKADAIATIEVHPTDHNLVYVAAVGNPFAPNKERGVFRSKDGGKSWEHILAKDDSTGAYHVRIDPNNPRVIYATLWQAYRNGHSMSSGGKGCGLYKSVDGGDTWVSLNEKPGMPKGLLGKIGVAISPANSNRLYALIENAKGGLFSSNDAGETWRLVNDDKNLWQRPWYYMNLQADPKNVDGVIILNVNAFKSTDGGKTIRNIRVHHGDTHDVWINPNNPENFIIADDGGAEVTYNDGVTFSDVDIPTSQFYHVHLDNDFPYNIYGSQQDNSTVRIASRTNGYSIGVRDWYSVAGGESGYIAIDPKNSKITYGGSYDGYLTKQNAENGQEQNIMVYPENNMGHTSAEKKFRFQWTYPIIFSPHDNTRLYCTSQYVHVTHDEGHSWEIISPDLTRNDPKTTGATGGPITLDQTGAEIYATIFTLAESKLEKGNIWAGSDDGYLHVTRDNGKNWTNITLPTSQLGDFALMSMIHTSDFEKGKAYLAATRYMFGDRTPYLFKTSDYGKTWTSISKGIPSDEYTRVVREDPNKPGLLYAGTERGIYVSFDDGASWNPLNLNMPISPIRDLQIHDREKDLVVATHGLSFWILDDVTPLHQIKDGMALADQHLFKPRHAYRMEGGDGGRRGTPLDEGKNAANGVLVNYYLKETPKEELKLQFLTMTNDTIITFSSKKDLKGEPFKVSKDFYENPDAPKPNSVSTTAGLNRFVWNMRYADATEIQGEKAPMWAGNTTGPKVVPGQYKVRMILGDKLLKEEIAEIKKDPRVDATDADFKAQFDLLMKIHKKLDESHRNINDIREIRKAVTEYMKAVKDTVIISNFQKITKPMLKNLDDLEQNLLQNKAKAMQDLLAYPIRLNDKMAGIAGVVSSADTKPTKASHEVFNDISNKIDKTSEKLKKIVDEDVPAFNNLVKQNQLPAINLKQKKVGTAL